MNHPKVVNSKVKMYDEYIGRPSKWGNPFSHLPSEIAEYRVKDRNESIQSYANWVVNQEDLLEDLYELEGKVLGCFCDPEPCHGSILALLVEYTYTRDILKDIEIIEEGKDKGEIINIINEILRKIKTPIIIEGSTEFRKLVISIINHINKQKKENIFYIEKEEDRNIILTLDTKSMHSDNMNGSRK